MLRCHLHFRKIILAAAAVPAGNGGGSDSGVRKGRGLERHAGDGEAERERKKACPAEVMVLPFTTKGG